MAGTKAGGLKAAATNKAKYGKGFYSRIGKKGGQNGRTGGFYNNPELARHAGQKGGKIGDTFKEMFDKYKELDKEISEIRDNLKFFINER